MVDIMTMGELLVDFIPGEKNRPLKDVNNFSKAAGGSPANVAAGLGRLGVDCGFIGKVGEDSFGEFLLEKLQENNVDTTYLLQTEEAMTTLAFVSLTEDGDRDFAFYRKPGADMLLSPEDLEADCLNEVDIFHFGTISLSKSPARETTYYLLELAEKNEVFVSFDPNIRLPLWDYDLEALREHFFATLPHADLVRMNIEELLLLTDPGLEAAAVKKNTQAFKSELAEICGELLTANPDYLIITAGEMGAFFISEEEMIYSAGYDIEAVDTTGAGDAFTAGMLSELLAKIKDDRHDDIDWQKVLDRGNRFGAYTSRRYGAIPAMPPEDGFEI